MLHATLLRLLFCLMTFRQTSAIQAIKCSNWYLRSPKEGSLECSHQGEEAIQGTTCTLTCEPNYAPSHEEMKCQPDGSWHPTKSPLCTPDGSLTVIVVPAVVGSLVALFIASFIYARTSNRCQSSRKPHEDVEAGTMGVGGIVGGEEEVRTGGVVVGGVRPGKEFLAAQRSSSVEVHQSPPVVKKGKPRFRLHIRSPGGALRRRFGKFKRKKKSGPRKIVGLPVEAGSICGDPPTQESSSSSEKEEEVAPSSHEEAPAPKKSPPPRPPAPKLGRAKKSRRHEVTKKQASSGYSSDEENEKKRKKKKKDLKSKRTKNNGSKKAKTSLEGKDNPDARIKKPVANPYDNYPVAGSDRQYLDFEHDYRKSGHIFEQGGYHPQYHPVESFPIKPPHKKKKKKEEDKKRPRKKRKTSGDGDAKETTGGVKYYSIKQDRDEIRRHRKKERSRRKDERRKEERSVRKRRDSSPRRREDHKPDKRSKSSRRDKSSRKSEKSSRKSEKSSRSKEKSRRSGRTQRRREED